jgi:nicotinamidase-related amidase
MQFPANPGSFAFEPARSALLVIDMQRDFLEPGGFGAALGNDVSILARAIPACVTLLAAARAAGLFVVHTREGHRPDLSDCPPAKLTRAPPGMRIGDIGPMGRILVRGEPGHEIVAPLAPLPGEAVLDKPGKGAFWATDLEPMLRHRGIEALLVAGVTTEVCVSTTVREANDRGFRCAVIAEACASYFPAFHDSALAMIAAQGGIFGWVARLDDVTAALAAPSRSHAA